jgi:hypothetical protein
MINLLPPHARKKVQVEYWVRVFSVWVALMGLACIIIGLMLIPSLILVQSQLNLYDNEYQNASAQNSVYTSLEESVNLANTVSMQLMSSNSEAVFSKLLFEVEKIARRTVVLDSIAFTSEEAPVESIQLSGEAPSRSLLVQFRDDLEESPLFKSVELPLSNLAKDKDVPFNITIIISNENLE